MKDKCMLSIYVATFNHEHYIEKALDSIFMQKTNYTYEVLVGEDCSTDHTRNILKKYEKDHKELIDFGKLQIFYREHNMYKKSPNNGEDLRKRCTGKYIIALEGDDYWIDDEKIEKQINFLENNPSYIAVAHNCRVVDENGNSVNEKYPECTQNEYTIAHFMSNILPGQLTTLMYKNIYNDNSKIDCTLLNKGLAPGDKLNVLVLLCNGKIHCMQECMSAYRHVISHGHSFSATYKYNFQKEYVWNREVQEYLKNYPDYSKYGDVLLVRCLFKGVKSGQCTVKRCLRFFWDINHKIYAVYMWTLYKYRKDICHQQIWI